MILHRSNRIENSPETNTFSGKLYIRTEYSHKSSNHSLVIFSQFNYYYFEIIIKLRFVHKFFIRERLLLQRLFKRFQKCWNINKGRKFNEKFINVQLKTDTCSLRKLFTHELFIYNHTSKNERDVSKKYCISNGKFIRCLLINILFLWNHSSEEI